MFNYRYGIYVVFLLSVWSGLAYTAQTHAQTACDMKGLTTGPLTDTSKTFIRAGNGQWGAPRGEGKTHQGVDIVVNASHSENQPYAVFPVANGTVAYARLNGSETSGFGNLIVVDHGNGCYSLYAHLAGKPFTPMKAGGNLLRQVGDPVDTTDLLGYFVDIQADVDSSGNAQKTASEARHQVHFAFIQAPSGRRSKTSLSDLLKSDGTIIDPTPYLLSKGYKVR